MRNDAEAESAYLRDGEFGEPRWFAQETGAIGIGIQFRVSKPGAGYARRSCGTGVMGNHVTSLLKRAFQSAV
jgi:hypothetical protein